MSDLLNELYGAYEAFDSGAMSFQAYVLEVLSNPKHRDELLSLHGEVIHGREHECWEYDNEDSFLGVEYIRGGIYYPDVWPTVVVVKPK